MATRKTFSDDDSIANAIPHNPVKRYACTAHECPMPGVMSGESGRDVCAYHWNTNAQDWPRITRTLLDWAIVTEEIVHCRRVLTAPETATNPEAIADEFRRAWARVEAGADAWVEELKPQPGRGGHMDSYGSWALRLERFIGQRVVDVLRHRVGSKAA